MTKHPAIEHALVNLPDSIRDRKAILADCQSLLPENDAAHRRASTMLQLLLAHENMAQLALPLKIETPAKDFEPARVLIGAELRNKLVERLWDIAGQLTAGKFPAEALVSAMALLQELQTVCNPPIHNGSQQ